MEKEILVGKEETLLVIDFKHLRIRSMCKRSDGDSVFCSISNLNGDEQYAFVLGNDDANTLLDCSLDMPNRQTCLVVVNNNTHESRLVNYVRTKCNMF